MHEMRIIGTSLALIFVLVIHLSGQTVRVFDNFDRSQGVTVYKPPSPPDPNAGKVAKRVKRNGKWVTIYEDPLVKKTASTKPSVVVTDGLATREGGFSPNSVRLVMGSNTTLKGFTTGNPIYDQHILDSSRKYRIDPLLIYAQMHQESAFKLHARSHKGASGLMQLMPATARRFGVTSIYDPKQNIEAGVRYMRWLLDHFNQDIVLALAGYNAGEGAVMKHGWRIPPYRETQEYVRRISARYNSISDPSYIKNVRTTDQQLAKVEQKEAPPLTVIEAMPMTIRTADGKMMLVNQ